MSRNYKQDEKLLERIRNGDEAEVNAILKELYLKYWPTFSSHFLKTTKLTHNDVEDVYSRSFTTFYLNIKDQKLQPPLKSSLQTYLIGIGNNYMLKHIDRSFRRRELSIDNLELVQQDYASPFVEKQHDKEETARLVQKMLNQLDEGCRKLIRLSYIEGNASDAIVQKMNIASELAMRQRKFKCLEKLRKLFNNSKDK